MRMRMLPEIEHPVYRACIRIERPVYALAVQPVVLDEPQHRALIRYRMIHEVRPRPPLS